MSIIEAQGITHSFGTRPVLNGAAMSVEAGEVVGLIGPNGTGKTTLLRALAGLITVDEGTVTLEGQPLATMAHDARARAVAYLAQGGESNWAVSVETLVGLGRLPHMGPWRGMSSSDRAAVTQALADCDAESLTSRPLNRLSGGERARVLLARALAQEPKVLLADEPVAGLDPAHALDVMAVLRARACNGAGIVVVIHDLTLAARHCDRLVLIADGRVLAAGVPDAVLSDANLASAYGIRAHRGMADGQPYVVPMARTDVAPMARTSKERPDE
jgi:iron complex transport system ATP-binding protein